MHTAHRRGCCLWKFCFYIEYNVLWALYATRTHTVHTGDSKVMHSLFFFFAAMAQQPQVLPHELESAQRAIKQNLIVNLPAGTDKIPIIALVVDHFRCTAPLKKVMIAAPTRQTVIEAAARLQVQCTTTPKVIELLGQELNNRIWDKILEENEILVGTPEMLRRALVDTNLIQMSVCRCKAGVCAFEAASQDWW